MSHDLCPGAGRVLETRAVGKGVQGLPTVPAVSSWCLLTAGHRAQYL